MDSESREASLPPVAPEFYKPEDFSILPVDASRVSYEKLSILNTLNNAWIRICSPRKDYKGKEIPFKNGSAFLLRPEAEKNGERQNQEIFVIEYLVSQNKKIRQVFIIGRDAEDKPVITRGALFLEQLDTEQKVKKRESFLLLLSPEKCSTVELEKKHTSLLNNKILPEKEFEDFSDQVRNILSKPTLASSDRCKQVADCLFPKEKPVETETAKKEIFKPKGFLVQPIDVEPGDLSLDKMKLFNKRTISWFYPQIREMEVDFEEQGLGKEGFACLLRNSESRVGLLVVVQIQDDIEVRHLFLINYDENEQYSIDKGILIKIGRRSSTPAFLLTREKQEDVNMAAGYLIGVIEENFIEYDGEEQIMLATRDECLDVLNSLGFFSEEEKEDDLLKVYPVGWLNGPIPTEQLLKNPDKTTAEKLVYLMDEAFKNGQKVNNIDQLKGKDNGFYYYKGSGIDIVGFMGERGVHVCNLEKDCDLMMEGTFVIKHGDKVIPIPTGIVHYLLDHKWKPDDILLEVLKTFPDPPADFKGTDLFWLAPNKEGVFWKVDKEKK